MSRIVTVQSNFTSGEIDPRLNGRVDLQQYYNALETAQNVTIEPQGGINRRDGSEFVIDVPRSTEHVLNANSTLLAAAQLAVVFPPWDGTELFARSAVWFKPDGTKMYIAIRPDDDNSYIYDTSAPHQDHYMTEIDLSTAWDLTTMSAAGNFALYGLGPCVISYNGSYGFRVMGDTNKNIKRETLSTPWSFATMTGTSLTPSATWGDGQNIDAVYDIQFNDDGTKMFAVANIISDNIYLIEYSLSSAWDLTTTTYVDKVAVGDSSADQDVRYFHVTNSGKTIHFKDKTYTVPSAWDLTSIAQSTSSVFNATGGITIDRDRVGGLYTSFNTQDFYIRDDESRMYIPSDYTYITTDSASLHEYFPQQEPTFKMVPFEFSVDDSYILVFTGNKMLIFKDGVQVTTINGQPGQNHLVVPSLTSAYIDNLNFTQAADSLILTHEDMHPQFIQRGGSDSTWTVTDLSFSHVPKYAYTLNVDAPQYSITPSATTGNITLTASAVTTDTGTAQAGTSTTLTLKSATSYTSDDECNGLSLHLTGGTGSGQHRHISDYNATTKVATVYPAFTTTPDNTTQYSVKAFGEDSVDEYVLANNGFGRARITEYVSDTVVKAFVEINFFDTDALTSGNWELEYGYEDVWSDSRGWPRSCVFHEGRLFLGGSKSRPSTLWGSRVSDFFNFDPGEQLDDSSIEATLDTGKFNAIVDLYSGRNLQIFTTGGEFFIPQTLGDPITPSTLSVKEQTSNGVKPGIPVVNIDGSTLFIQRQGKSLSEFLFNDSVAGYVSTRISLLSSHLLKSPASMAVRKATSTDEGDRVMIANSDDGSIACFTLLRSEQIVAPSEWTTDGKYIEVGVDISDVYTVVKRTIGGSDKFFIERFVEGLNTDCAKSATVTASTSSVTGLGHLQGETLDVLSDGVVESDKTVSTSTIAFTTAATSSYEVGLSYASTIKTMPFEGKLPSGPTRTFKKRILAISVDLYQTQAVTIDGEAVTFDADDNGLIAPYTGFKRKGSLLGYNKDATITITQSEPLDMTILSLDYKVSTGQ